MVMLGMSITATSDVLKKTFRGDSGPYKVEIICEMTPNENTFDEKRPSWEDRDKVIELTETYFKQGKILDSSTHREDNKITWSYVFKDRLSFEDWNRSIFLNGYFKPTDVPSHFKYTINGKLV